MPRPAGAGSYAYSPPRRSARVSQAAPRGSKPIVSRKERLRSGSELYARTASKPWRACSAGTSGCSAVSGSSGRAGAALRLDAVATQALRPEVERCLTGYSPDDLVDHAVAGATGGGAGILEEGEVEARVRVLVAVEEVVDGRVVLVDRFLHQPQAEDADVEVDVRLR